MAALDDPSRLAVFDAEISQIGPDPVLDACVQEAAGLAGAPIAVISLVMERVQLFRSQVGLPADLAVSRGTARCDSFCQLIVTTEQPLVVDDALNDARVPQKLVQTHGVRAYAGVPLTIDGVLAGSLCVIDVVPREFAPSLIEQLRALSVRATERFRELRAAAPVVVETPAPPNPAEYADLISQDARIVERSLIEIGPAVRLVSALSSRYLSPDDFARGMEVVHHLEPFFEDLTSVIGGIRRAADSLAAGLRGPAPGGQQVS